MYVRFFTDGQLVQDLRLYFLLPSTRILERLEASTLHPHQALPYICRSNGRHLDLHFRLCRYLELPNVLQGRLHQERSVRLHLPRSQHLLHLGRLLGYLESQEALWSRSSIQLDAFGFPHRYHASHR